MAQYDLNFTDYERIFRKRYKIVIFLTLVSIVFSVLFSRAKPPLYRSSSSVRVDRTSTLGLGADVYGYMSWDNIETQTKVVTSFPVVKKAAVFMKVIPQRFDTMETISDPRVLARIGALSSKVTAGIKGGTNIINITVVSGKREEARDLANAMAKAYKVYTFEEKKGHITKTKGFVRKQIDRCRKDLARAEQAIQRFEDSLHVPSITNETERAITDVAELERKLDEVRTRERIISGQRRKLKKRLERPFGTATQGSPSGVLGQDNEFPETSSQPQTYTKMDWITQFGISDPGLRQLNTRLIELQILQRDQLKFYKKDHPVIADLEAKIRETISEIISEYDVRLAEIHLEKEELQTKLDRKSNYMNSLSDQQMQHARLLRNLRITEGLFTELTTKIQDVMVSEAGVVDDVTVMSVAGLPGRPINKSLSRVVLIGLFLGFLVGVIVAILREILDTSIGTIEDVEDYLNVPVLAVIPHMEMSVQEEKLLKKLGVENIPHLKDRARLITQFDPKNPAAEAYRILRTNLEYLSLDKSAKTILVTSSAMQEGKSTTISNLAIAFAQEGKRVCLVGCNLRRPSLYRVFGLNKGPGMADVLIDKARWQDCVRTVSDFAVGELNIEDILAAPGIENLNMITFGRIPPNPTELLASKKMDKFLAEVGEEYDIVLIDCPPLLPVADSSLLATKANGVILVYQVGKAPRNTLRRGKERLENVKAKLLGLVLNDIRPEVSGASYVSQYYMHYYGEPTDRPGSKGKTRSSGSDSGGGSQRSAGKVISLSLLSVLGASAMGVALAMPGKMAVAAKQVLWKFTASFPFIFLFAQNPFVEEKAKDQAVKPKSAMVAQQKTNPVESGQLTSNRSAKESVESGAVFTVQLYVSESKTNALSLVRRLKKRGVPAWSIQTMVKGAKQFRVCAGRFTNKGLARNSAAEWKRQNGFGDARIVRVTLRTSPKKKMAKAVGKENARRLKKTGASGMMRGASLPQVSGRLSIQVASFKDQNAALKTAREFSRKYGIVSWVAPPRSGANDTFFPVRLGKFTTRQEAENALDRLAQRFKGSAFVVEATAKKEAGNFGSTASTSSKKAEPNHGKSYSIQFASLRDLNQARDFCQLLISKGISSAWVSEPAVTSAGTFFRVRAGSFASKSEAESFQAKMDEKGFPDAFVTQL